MCGRVIIPKSKDIIDELHLTYQGEIFPLDINVPPTLPIPLITDDSHSELQYFRWSLIPYWSKEKPKYSTFNARIESLNSGVWKHIIGTRHCVIITDGFYEWQKVGDKVKQPHLIRMKDQRFTLMAGLWDRWTDKSTGEIIHSCSVITRPPNERMSSIHDRMPCMLTQAFSKQWLDSGLPLSERMKALAPIDDDQLEISTVQKVGDIDEYANFC